MAIKRKPSAKNTSNPPASAKEPMTDKLESRTQKIYVLLKEGDIAQVVQLMKQSKENVGVIKTILSGEPISDYRPSVIRENDDRKTVHQKLSGLGVALLDAKKVQENAISAVGRAAMEGVDLSGFFDGLVDRFLEAFVNTVFVDSALLSTGSFGRRATWFPSTSIPLTVAIECGDQKTRIQVLSGLMKFLNSEDFMKAARDNDRRYLEAITRINYVILRIDQAERKAA